MPAQGKVVWSSLHAGSAVAQTPSQMIIKTFPLSTEELPIRLEAEVLIMTLLSHHVN